MAYQLSIDDQKKKEEALNNGSLVSNTAGPNEIGVGRGDVGGIKTQVASAAAPSGAAGPSSSGRFVNLQNYINANQPQAQGLAGNVAGTINTRANDATSAINTAKTQFTNDVTSGTNKVDQNLINKAIADSTSFAASSEADKFKDMISGKYAGPEVNTSTVWEPASAKVNSALQAGELTKTAGGQTELLREMAANPYSRGGLAFNQLLLQNVDPARETVATAAENVKPLQGQFTNTLTEAAKKVEAAKLASSAAAENVVNQIAGEGGALWKQQQDLNARVEAARQEEIKNQGIIQSIINGALPVQAISERTLAGLGITQAQLAEIAATNKEAKGYGEGGIKGENYFARTPADYIKTGNIASEQDIAKYKALNALVNNARDDLKVEFGSTTGGPGAANARATLANQIASFKQKKAYADAQANALITANQKKLASLGWTPSKGSSSSDWGSYTNASGKSLASVVNDPFVQKLANSAFGYALSALNPMLGMAYSIARVLGLNVAQGFAEQLGITGVTPGYEGGYWGTPALGGGITVSKNVGFNPSAISLSGSYSGGGKDPNTTWLGHSSSSSTPSGFSSSDLGSGIRDSGAVSTISGGTGSGIKGSISTGLTGGPTLSGNYSNSGSSSSYSGLSASNSSGLNTSPGSGFNSGGWGGGSQTA